MDGMLRRAALVFAICVIGYHMRRGWLNVNADYVGSNAVFIRILSL